MWTLSFSKDSHILLAGSLGGLVEIREEGEELKVTSWKTPICALDQILWTRDGQGFYGTRMGVVLFHRDVDGWTKIWRQADCRVDAILYRDGRLQAFDLDHAILRALDRKTGSVQRETVLPKQWSWQSRKGELEIPRVECVKGKWLFIATRDGIIANQDETWHGMIADPWAQVRISPNGKRILILSGRDAYLFRADEIPT
jgi:hypothetical protein